MSAIETRGPTANLMRALIRSAMIAFSEVLSKSPRQTGLLLYLFFDFVYAPRHKLDGLDRPGALAR